MKCMICGGQTLPGAKLCLPCRAALRRARDDTISELLPLPRRREAFAFSHSPDIGRPAPLAPKTRPAAERSFAGVRTRRVTSAQLHAAAVVAFVAAAGVLTFIMARELQRERTPGAGVEASIPAAEPRGVAPSVSPSTMLGAARDETGPATATHAAEIDALEPVPVLPAPVERKSERPAKAARTAKAPIVLDPFPAAAPIEAPVIITAPAAPPAPVIRPAPQDRAALLSAALGRCSGDFFARFGCEHRARAQYCEGQWGQNPQCPAGVVNDHGQ